MAQQEANIITAAQLIENTASRDVIKCTTSLDLALGGGIPLGSTVLLGGIFKSGKAGRLDSKILTKTGWKEMREMKQGSMVCGSDGKFYQVIGVYPQGVRPIYRVTMEDGGYTECSDDHLWFTITKADKNRGRLGSVKSTMMVKSNLIGKAGSNGNLCYKQFIPYVKPVQFDEKPLPIHPYVLGVLLGDGSIGPSACGISFDTTDHDIASKINDFLQPNYSVNKITKCTTKYSIVINNNGTDSMRTKLNKLDLMKLSYEKHIPQEYLINSIENRIWLLRGLMDTDGYCEKKYGKIEYSTTSPKLKDDVKFLAQSLGARVTCSSRMGSYTKNGQNIQTRVNYRVHISFHSNDFNPFYCERKASRYENKQQNRLRAIASIEYVGDHECQCIEVNAPDGLYVADDFIVTHNTSTALQYAANAYKEYGAECYYFGIEGRLTHKVLSQVQNIDAEKVNIVTPPPILEKKTDKVLGYEKWNAERWWTEIGQTIINHPNSVIIVDSIANMSTERETAEGMGFQGRGDKNKAESQFCRIYGDLVIQNKVTLFLLCQVMANTSGYGKSIQMKVGNAIKHQSDVIISCDKVEKWQPNSKGVIMGHNVHMTIEESPMGSPHTNAIVPLRYGFGIDTIMDTINHAINWGIIEKRSSWYVLPFEEKDGKMVYSKDSDDRIKLQGEPGLRNWFVLNTECLKIVEENMNKIIYGAPVEDSES